MARPTHGNGGVHRISLATTYAVGEVNVFLLADASPVTLIDTGQRTDTALDELEAKLGLLDLGIEDIEQVLLSHHHADHVGLARAVRQRSGCVVAGQRDLLGYLSDVRAQRAAETEYHVGVMALNGAPQVAMASHRQLQVKLYGGIESVEVDVPLDHGQVIEAGGRRLRTVVRPGHSATDTVFLDETNGVAFVGDHLLRDKTSNPLVWLPVGPDPDPAARVSTMLIYEDAMRETARMNVETMYSGHGEPIVAPAELVERRLGENRRHSERALAELRRDPVAGFEVARRIWGDAVDDIPFDLLSMALGSLDLLCAAGDARRHVDDDGSATYSLA